MLKWRLTSIKHFIMARPAVRNFKDSSRFEASSPSLPLEEALALQAQRDRVKLFLALGIAAIVPALFLVNVLFRQSLQDMLSGGNNGVPWLMGTVVGGVLAVKILRTRGWFSETTYYGISGSRTRDGAHRCVHCGGRGIWRKGEYRSNNVYARCSACEEPLFRTSK